MTELVYAQIGQLSQTELFTYILPFLFVFAVVYGILSHASGGIPKSNSARAIIALVIGLAIIPVAPLIVGKLTVLSTGFAIVVSGLLVFIILTELLGVKSGKDVFVVDQSGKVVKRDREMTNIFEAHGKTFAILVIIIAAMLFWASGGFEILGVKNIPSLNPSNYPLLFFLGVIALIVWWLTAEKKPGEL